MKKHSWLVITIHDQWGRWSYAQQWNHSNNLLTLFATDVETVNICNTKREALQIAAEWNESFKRNGTAKDWSKGATA